MHSRPRNPWLDGVRVSAVLALLLYHLASMSAPGPSALGRGLHALAHAGYVGTDLLLSLAAVLMVGALERSDAGPQTLRGYLVRRAWRALPAYLVFLGLYLFALPNLWPGLLHKPCPDVGTPRAALPYLLSLTANLWLAQGGRTGCALEPLFAVPLGAQLTLLGAPLVLLFGRRPRAVLAALAISLLLASALRLWLMPGNAADPWRIYFSTETRLDAFAWGLGLSLLAPRLARWAGHLALTSCALFLLVLALTHGLSLGSRLTVLVGYPVVGLWAAAMVNWAATRSPASPAPTAAERSAHGARLLRLLSDASYSTYLVKLPLLYLLVPLAQPHPVELGGPLVLDWSLRTLASLGAGIVFYGLVDRWVLRALSRRASSSARRRVRQVPNA